TTRSNTITLTMSTNRTEFAHFHPIDMAFTNSIGDWTGATNWSPNLVPVLDENVNVYNGGSITLNTNVDCAALTFGNVDTVPAINGTGVLTVHAPSSWYSGPFNGSGRLIIAPEASLLIANAGSVALSGWSLENGGSVQWFGPAGILLGSGAVITNR